MSSNFDHIVAAEKFIAPHSTVLPLVLLPRGLDEVGRPISRGVPFLLHADNRIELDRNAYCLRLSQASTLNFPIHYTAKANPYTHLPLVHSLLGDEIDQAAVWKNLPWQTTRYEAITGQTIDYLLIVGTQTPDAQRIVFELRRSLQGRYVDQGKSALLPGFVLLRRVSSKT